MDIAKKFINFSPINDIRDMETKACTKCGETKAVTEYYLRKNGYRNSHCNECRYKINLESKLNNLERYNNQIKNFHKNNPKYISKYHNSIPAGVYGVYYRWLLLYVGESKTPYRRVAQHLSTPEIRGGTKNGTINGSKVVKLLVERGLNGKHLSYTMLDYADDISSRLELERKYQRELKPYINPL